jgi:hypothetical protein
VSLRGHWPGLLTTSLSAVYKVRTSAVLATACHQGSTPTLRLPRPHTLLNLRPFICQTNPDLNDQPNHARLPIRNL